MKGSYMEINRRAFRRVVWVGKAAQFCSGLLAMLALVVVMGVLTVVMLAATTLPVTAVRQKQDLRGRRDSGNTTTDFAGPYKEVASRGQ